VVPGWKSLTERGALLYSLAKGTPIIYSSDTILDEPSNRHFQRILEGAFRLFLKQVAAFWIPGEAAREFMEHFGAPRDRIFQGSYCLDIDYILRLAEAALPRRQEIREQLGLGDHEWLFLFVGRMLPMRGLNYLLEAYDQLRRRSPQARLLLIGDGIERPRLEQQCSRLGLTGVIFLEPMPMERLTDYYLAADAYVMPALFERYSLALAQAAICGLPIVSTEKVGGVKDYVKDGFSGYLVPPGDSKALMEAMWRIMTLKDEAVAMARNAFQLAKSRTISWAAEQLEAAVFEALETKKRG
jgi:glycosyltransferase involved in cell wall biosynthesis